MYRYFWKIKWLTNKHEWLQNCPQYTLYTYFAHVLDRSWMYCMRGSHPVTWPNPRVVLMIWNANDLRHFSDRTLRSSVRSWWSTLCNTPSNIQQARLFVLFYRNHTAHTEVPLSQSLGDLLSQPSPRRLKQAVWIYCAGVFCDGIEWQ